MKQNKHKHVNVILMPIIVLVFCFLTFEFCFSGKVSAVSLTVSMSDNSAISLGVAGTEEGSFAKSANRDFTVSTDNITGYTLSIKSDTVSGNDGTGVLLYNGSDDTYVINSIGSENNFPLSGISENVYKNGDSNNNTFTNTWGYKPSMIDSSNNSNFLPAPDATGDTINVTSCANGTQNSTCTNASDTYSITLGAKVDSTVRIGSYSNTFVILAVANAVPYTIIYNNGVVTSMPVDVSSNSMGNTIDIASTVPVRSGYTFLGWCDTTPTTNNGVDSCPSGHTVYNPNGAGTNLSYTLDRTGGSNNLSLYAMWSGSGGGGSVVPVTVNFAGSGVEGVTFTNTSDGVTTTLTANEDDTVVRLEQGVAYNITMTPSYRFGTWSTINGTLGSTSTLNTTYSTNANDTLTVTGNGLMYMQDLTLSTCQVNVGVNGNPEGIGDTLVVIDKRINDGDNNYDADDDGHYTVRYINGECWMTQNLRIKGAIHSTYSNFTGSSFDVSAYDANNNQCSSNNAYNNACSHVPNSTDLATLGNGATFKTIGVWYNYYAATAGTISGASNVNTATRDICPSGWHLPSAPGNTSGTDFNKLAGNTYSDWQDYTTGFIAFGAVMSGSYSGSVNNTTQGMWWASGSGTNSSYRYILQFDSSLVEFRTYCWNGRGAMSSIRCVKSS